MDNGYSSILDISGRYLFLLQIKCMRFIDQDADQE